MPLDNAGDLLFQLPRPGEPESNMIGGMAAPSPAPQAMPDTSLSLGVATQEPNSWVYDFNAATGSARATFNGEVAFTSGGAATAGVASWNGRTGAVVLTAGDVSAAGGAPIASPTFTGVPAAPTASPGNATTQIATTAFVAQAIAGTALVASFNGRTGAVTLSTSDITTAGGAPAASPAFTGTPTAPTAAPGTQTGQIATTQFVASAIAGTVVSWNGRTGLVTLNLSDIQSAGGAPLNAPAFTGIPTAPTATAGTATGQLATTAFVTNAIQSATVGVSSFNTRTGAVTLTAADVTNVGGALLAGPAFTGNPTAPTQTAGDNSTRLATTAFVMTQIGAMAPVVATFNGRSGTVTLQASDVTGVGGALLASPVFTGTPAGPTPTVGDNSTRLATTAFVTGNFVELAGDTMSGDLTIQKANPLFVLTKTVNTQNAVISGCAAGGTPRWNIVLGDSTPGGANAGQDFNVRRLNDAGVDQGAPIFVRRSDGAVSIVGTTTGDNPRAGDVGEFLSIVANIASPGTGQGFLVTQLSLTAGDWDVWGMVGWNGDVNASTLQGGLNINTAVMPTYGAAGMFQLSAGSALIGNASQFAIPFIRANLAAAGTIYLLGFANWSGGSTHNVGGAIYARRAR